MNTEVLARFQALRLARETFALATVIRVHGSASAKPGSTALISREGKNLLGWVGGGCAESFVCEQARESIVEKKTRIVTADLDDEVFGLGMPCGGIMDVYIEPYFPQGTLHLRSEDENARTAAALAHHLGLRVVGEGFARLNWDAGLIDECRSDEVPFGAGDLRWPPTDFLETQDTTIGDVFLGLGLELVQSRERSGRPLVETKGVSQAHPLDLRSVATPKILILGHSRITEELAFLAAWLKWPTTVNGSGCDLGLYPAGTKLISGDPALDEFPVDEKTFVVIASHHKGDHLSLERALAARSPYVGLVASAKRSKLVFEYFFERGHCEEELGPVHAPAGIEMDCQSPAEIALSIFCEILLARTWQARQ